MALQAKEVLDCPCDTVADVGYDHGHEVEACLEAGSTPYVSRPITSANKQLGLFSKDDFTYDRGTDTYQCPAGAQLTFRFDTVERGRHISAMTRRRPAEAVPSSSSARGIKAGGG